MAFAKVKCLEVGAASAERRRGNRQNLWLKPLVVVLTEKKVRPKGMQ